ncbi:MAG: indole-3-glycerol phosphate synthase TrpC [bacterium]
MTILDKIIEHKRDEVALLKKRNPLSAVREAAETRGNFRSLRQIMNDDETFHFICEIKKASPSRGVIREDFDPVRQAAFYSEGGASAISVLTDEKFFMGHIDYLGTVRRVVNLPILRKDFIIDPYQIYESKAGGADLILLIASVLSSEQIDEFIGLARELRLDVLLEVARPQEAEEVSHPEQIIIGINNRDLHSFEVRLENSLEIRPLLPKEALVIAESGIHSKEDCRKLQAHGFRGALIGEALMTASDPVATLREFVRGTQLAHPA